MPNQPEKKPTIFERAEASLKARVKEEVEKCLAETSRHTAATHASGNVAATDAEVATDDSGLKLAFKRAAAEENPAARAALYAAAIALLEKTGNELTAGQCETLRIAAATSADPRARALLWARLHAGKN